MAEIKAKGRKDIGSSISVVRDSLRIHDDVNVIKMNLSASEELFAQGVAKGLTQTQAAIDAGYSSNSAHVTASKIARKPKIRERIRQLQSSMLHSVEAARADHLQQLVELRELAKQKGQIAAAIKSEELRGRVLGLYVEQVLTEVVGSPNKLDQASPTELRKAINAAITSLDLGKPVIDDDIDMTCIDITPK